MPLDVKIEKRLNSFHLDVRFRSEARRIGILGASGSGKSMSLRCIAGIVQPDRGSILLDDRLLFDAERRINLPAQKRRVGYLFQSYALFPTMTVEENIACGLGQLGRAERERRVSALMERCRLSGLRRRYPRELSGGQQQRVALARILAYRPGAILLDEPFSALDIYLRDRMQEELREQLSDYEGIVIMVSHSRDELYRFSEEILTISDGRVDRQGATKELFADPGTKTTAMLTGCKNISRAERIDAHMLTASDWGITLYTEREIPERLSHVGFRAHCFLPVYGERRKNCIRFRLSSIAELPFERNYYFEPETEDEERGAAAGGGSESHEAAQPSRSEDSGQNENALCWFAQRELWEELDHRGLPDFLELPERELLFLQESV
ncbi:ATP-binding cassette domain-containing protein [Oribacterium sp. oral taxon 102]|uniref:sulfate/molybdate ABC transporter ATP-binding protein n=1 Tax=Oribacterium sp. oral taxon 102 TaxID=671214 RepID=UPI0015BFC96A|nr:ATP-binding cassette domain-containing protein [Oribacterium sp. oral taxon 102]NWO22220.1 ATP-binding cassette domain-containing protein [Oribacterium sp. oral taxon 102]